MSGITVTTGTASETRYFSQGLWLGQSVLIEEPLWVEDGPCAGHDLEPLTYFGEDTGGLYCWRCCGIATHAERGRAERAAGVSGAD